MPKKIRKLLASGIIAAILSPTAAAAQWVKLDILSYHHPDPRSETVVVLSEKGIFIAHSPVRKNPVAAFDLQHMPPETTTSMFLRYGSESNVPRAVVLPGEGNEYRFAGDAVFQLGEGVRVAQSTIGVVPYITIVAGSPGTEAVLGILGDQVVVNMAGKSAVRRFEANTDPTAAALGGGIFFVNRDALTIGGRDVAPGTRIGLRREPDFFCLEQGVALLPAKKLLEIQKLPRSERPAALDKAQAGAESGDSVLMLKASDSTGVAMEFASGGFLQIDEQEIAGRKVCASRPLVDQTE